jgi:hypothetical protein
LVLLLFFLLPFLLFPLLALGVAWLGRRRLLMRTRRQLRMTIRFCKDSSIRLTERGHAFGGTG